ncbi:GMC family oxidoreductase [Pseudonocardia halophobica]|uniref:Pyranose oxidase n=1 Tax=Pseudonocardia halophobica TaxID=29401 RepID=A0A9W6L250_9PSEU|nr:GMC oxidoreductase [Pseudonocardia halophobica]GLL09654.1 pyranose oxidase [Pseudonocardia halophobica]
MDRFFPNEADVVVVGSGPVGATYARVLSEVAPTARVAVFEVGPVLGEPVGGHVRNITDPAERERAQRLSEGPSVDRPSLTGAAELEDGVRRARPGTFLLESGWRQDGEDGLPAAAMSSNVGGMGAHWTGACPRPGDGERIAFLPDLDALLDEAERLLTVSADALADAPLADVVRARLGAALDEHRAADRRVQPMPLAVTRRADGGLVWSGSDVVFGEPFRTNPNATLTERALVTDILVEDGRACGVRVRDLESGAEHVVRAGYVVVAADALRTPQLLWASGIRPAALGRYLNDQPQVVYAVRLRDLPSAGTETGRAGALVAASGVSWVPYTSAEPFHGQVMQLDASPVPLTDGDEPAPGSIVGLGWFCAKELRAEDRVEFADDEHDGYGMPAMRIHYTLTGQDEASIAAAADAVRRAGRALGEPLDDRPTVLPPGSSLHYQGSVRMGEVDDGTSVCDPTCRVWGVDGLYVAGNGVIPTPTACNPTLTSVALAVAGARDIAGRLGGAPVTTHEHALSTA